MTEFMQSIIALIIIIPLIILTAYLFKRFYHMPSKKNSSLKILEQISIGYRQYIAVVQTEYATLIIGISPNQIQVLHQSPVKKEQTPYQKGAAHA